MVTQTSFVSTATIVVDVVDVVVILVMLAEEEVLLVIIEFHLTSMEGMETISVRLPRSSRRQSNLMGLRLLIWLTRCRTHISWKVTGEIYRTSPFPACEVRSVNDSIETDTVDLALNPTAVEVRNSKEIVLI